MTSDVSLTQQLQIFFQGDQASADALMREILPKLHQIAVGRLRSEHNGALTPTELIQEIWIRNLSKARWQIRNQGHFYAIASLAMRRVLVDFARSRKTDRRGGKFGDLPLEYAIERVSTETDAGKILEIGLLMEQLDESDSDAARIVDMHYFGGFTLQEIAQSTKLSFRQVRSRWERGFEFLKKKLKASSAGA